MKKKFLAILILLCSLCTLFAFAACNNSVNTGDTGNGGNQTEQPGGEEQPEQPDDEEPEPHVHDFKNYVYNNDATCTEDGTKTGTCSCGAKDTRIKFNSALGHTFEVYVSNGDATCLQNGTETATCIRCSEQDTREAKDSALGHDWDDGQITTPATCTTPGVRTFTCNHDHTHQKTEEIQIDPTAHDWNEGEIQKPATCTSPGQKYFTCNHNPEHHKTEEISKLAHQYGEWQEEIPTSCTAPGRRGYQECESCHLKYDREGVLIEEDDLTIAQIDHNYEFDHVAKKTCQEACAIVEKCSMCQVTQSKAVEDITLSARLTRMSGSSFNGYGNFENTYTIYAEGGYGAFQYKYEFYQASSTPAKVHDYSENNAFILGWSGYDASASWSLKVFCKDEAGNMTIARFSLRVDEFEFGGFDGDGGSIVRADLTCLEQKVDEGEHKFENYIPNGDATCTEPGTETATCELCHNAQDTREGTALGHAMQEVEAQEPTCTEIGWDAYQQCSRCNEKQNYTEKQPLGHDWDDGQITTPATCTTPGVRTFTCNRDHTHHKTEEINIDPTAHEYGEWIPQIDAECEKDGVLGHFECEYCHENFDEDYEHLESLKINPLGHEYEKDICIRCSQHTGLLYVQSEEHYILVSIGTCTEKKIVIAEEYEGLPVTEIGASAFRNEDSIQNVKIPKTIATIGEKAFYDCDGLESVTFEEDSHLSSIGSDAFSSCSRLTSIVIPRSVTSIGWSAFDYCSGLESVIFETDSNLTSIGYHAFYNCSRLTSIVIPKSVTSIEDKVFEGCTNLVSVTFEDPSGWYYTTSSYTTSGTDLDESQLRNESLAAVYLTKTYCSNYWKKKA